MKTTSRSFCCCITQKTLLVGMFCAFVVLRAMGATSEIFEDDVANLKIVTKITLSDFRVEDIWNEKDVLLIPQQTICVTARKALAGLVPKAETFVIDAIELTRFDESNYWYFVIRFSNGLDKKPETVRIVVKLNGAVVLPRSETSD